MNPVQENLPQPEQLPEIESPHEKLLRAPTLSEKLMQGKFKYILMLLFAFFVVNTGIYFLLEGVTTKSSSSELKNQQAILPTSTPIPTPKIEPFPSVEPSLYKNWKTYTAPDKSFSFKYPSEWIFSQSTDISDFGNKELQPLKQLTISFGKPITRNEKIAILSGSPIKEKDIPAFYSALSVMFLTYPESSKIDFKNFTGSSEENIQSKKFFEQNEMQVEEYVYGCQNICADLIFKQNNTYIIISSSPNADIDQLHTLFTTFNFAEPISSEGKMCGGIAAITCPKGYTCKMDGNYPDAGGKCTQESASHQPTSAPLPTRGTDQVFCAQDIKVCPDGSYVGRSGPDCKFVCPKKQKLDD